MNESEETTTKDRSSRGGWLADALPFSPWLVGTGALSWAFAVVVQNMALHPSTALRNAQLASTILLVCAAALASVFPLRSGLQLKSQWTCPGMRRGGLVGNSVVASVVVFQILDGFLSGGLTWIRWLLLFASAILLYWPASSHARALGDAKEAIGTPGSPPLSAIETFCDLSVVSRVRDSFGEDQDSPFNRLVEYLKRLPANPRALAPAIKGVISMFTLLCLLGAISAYGEQVARDRLDEHSALGKGRPDRGTTGTAETNDPGPPTTPLLLDRP